MSKININSSSFGILKQKISCFMERKIRILLTIMAAALLVLFLLSGLGQQVYKKIKKFIIQFCIAINPYPFQSILLELFFSYVIFFLIFIQHPLPITRAYPSLTDFTLYCGLLYFLLILFIHYVVPEPIGTFINRKGFKPNIRQLREHIGLYSRLLILFCSIVIFALGLGYLATTYTGASWWVITAVFVMLLAVAAIGIVPGVIHFLKKIPFLANIFSGLRLQSVLNALYKIKVSIIKVMRTTPTIGWILLALEIIVIGIYFIIPEIGNSISLKSPGDQDYETALYTISKNLRNDVWSKKEQMQTLKNGIKIDWTKADKLNDADLQTALYEIGYTTATEPDAAKYVRQNQNQVSALYKIIGDSEAELKRIKDELNAVKDYTAKQYLRKPVYTDNALTLGTFEDIKKGGDYDYQYTLSAWVFLHEQPPNHRPSYKYFTSLLNYGGNPNILFNPERNILQIKMKKGTQDTVIYETNDFKLQKWNNIVVNYDKGTLDIFINGELVSTTDGIIPEFKFANIVSGSDGGVSGGICNVVYYSGNLSEERIRLSYNYFKNKNPPVISSPFNNYISTPVEKIMNFKNKHPYISILGIVAMLSFSVGFVNHHNK